LSWVNSILGVFILDFGLICFGLWCCCLIKSLEKYQTQTHEKQSITKIPKEQQAIVLKRPDGTVKVTAVSLPEIHKKSKVQYYDFEKEKKKHTHTKLQELKDRFTPLGGFTIPEFRLPPKIKQAFDKNFEPRVFVPKSNLIDVTIEKVRLSKQPDKQLEHSDLKTPFIQQEASKIKLRKPISTSIFKGSTYTYKQSSRFEFLALRLPKIKKLTFRIPKLEPKAQKEHRPTYRYQPNQRIKPIQKQPQRIQLRPYKLSEMYSSSSFIPKIKREKTYKFHIPGESRLPKIKLPKFSLEKLKRMLPKSKKKSQYYNWGEDHNPKYTYKPKE